MSVKIKSVVFSVLFSCMSLAHGACDEVSGEYIEILHDNISDSLSLRIHAITNDHIGNGADGVLYQDIVKESIHAITHDELIFKHFEESLINEFSCEEIELIYNFISSDVGKKYNNYTLSYYPKEFINSEELKQVLSIYSEKLQKRVQRRREKIMDYLKNDQSQSHYTYVDLVVASKKLVEGTLLDKNVLSIRKVPKKYANAHFIRPKDVELIFGKRLNRELESGEAIILDFVE